MNSKLLAAGFLVLTLTACGSSSSDRPQPTADIPPPPAPAAAATAESGSKGMFGWLGAGGKGDDRKGVAVNAYLWRASLDSLSFMPMEQTDPFGGVIKTTWYVPPSTPNERLKVSVFILDSRLRAEAVRVSIFKQTKKPTGEWADSSVDPDTVTKLENVILDKARALKIQDE